MSANILEKLFGSVARVKILRLFLLNPDNIFSSKEISRRSRVSSDVVRREISLLKSIGLITKESRKASEVIELKNGRVKNKKKKIQGFQLDGMFPLMYTLKNLILNAVPIDKGKMLKSLKSVGRMKLIILAGVFIQSDESQVDLLLVGDGVKKNALEKELRHIEANIGKELSYALFDTKEFLYRLGMYDRFLRDVLDSPHEKALEKLEV